PRVHAAHRSAHDEPKMIHFEAIGHQPVLRLDHVAIAVMGKVRVQTIARLARLSVADAVGQNDVVTRRIQKLPLAEQFARKLRPDEIAAVAGGAVEYQDRIADDTLGVASRRANRAVMNAQLGQRLPALKMEILDDVI